VGKPWELESHATVDELVTFQLYMLEQKLIQLTDLSKSRNRFVCMSRVIDLQGFTLSHAGKKALGALGAMLGAGQANYPEMVDKLIIVNAPGLFSTIWPLVKVMLNARTAAKIIMIGYGQDAEIHKYIDPRELPVYLGGYRLDDITAPYDEKDGCGDAYVGARSVLTKTVPLKKGEVGYYEVRLIGKIDVNVEVTWNGEKDLFPKAKVTENVVGEVTAEEDGSFTVTLDNSYSFMTGKKCLWKVGIKKPAAPPQETKADEPKQ